MRIKSISSHNGVFGRRATSNGLAGESPRLAAEPAVQDWDRAKVKPAAASQLFFSTTPVDPLRHAELERRFFSTLLLPNGTYMTTHRGRLHDVDGAVCSRFQGRSSVRLLDFGVASGSTTLDLIEALEGLGILCETTVADICLKATLRRLGWLEILADSQRRGLQIATPWGVRCRPYKPSRSMTRKVVDRCFDALGLLARNGRPVTLVSSDLMRRPGVEAVERCVFEEYPGWFAQFDLVRAANLLNRPYFGEDQIRRACGILGSYLKPGGTLVIGRTLDEDGSNNATLFERRDVLEPVARIGAGAEIESIVSAVPLKPFLERQIEALRA